MPRFFLSFLAASALCVTSAVAAEPPKQPAPQAPPKAVDSADKLFDEAAAAFTAGRYAEAETKLEQVWTLKQTYDVAGNLGVVQAKRGKYPQAAEHLAWALQHFPLTEPAKARRGFEGELEKARAQSGTLRIQVSIDGAEVSVNGRKVGVTPIAGEVFVEPGPVSVTAQRDGYALAQQSVTVAKGEARDVSVVLAPIEIKRRSVVPGAVLGGVAGAALVTGVALFVAGKNKYADAQTLENQIVAAGNRCVAGAADPRCSQLHSTASTSDAFHDAGVGLLIGAGVAAVGTATYFLWPTSTASPRSGTVRVAPLVSATGGGLVVWGAL
jgi:tetratricopeptide (TPR) repeat protein